MKNLVENKISVERREFIANGIETVYGNLAYGDSWFYGLIDLLKELNADEIFYARCLLEQELEKCLGWYEAKPELKTETDLLVAYENMKKSGTKVLEIISIAYLLKEKK